MDLSILSNKLIDVAHKFTQYHFYDTVRSFPFPIQRTTRLNNIRIGRYDNYIMFLEDYKNLKSEQDMGIEVIPKELSLLRDCFDYIPMSSKFTKDHTISYIIKPKEETISDIFSYFIKSNFIEINQDLKTLEGFKTFILKKARIMGETFSSTLVDTQMKMKSIEFSKFFIYGQPGLGKTTLLNYLFSVYHDDFISDNVIWIRINLNNVRSAFLNLNDRLYSKFFRIFCQDYIYKYNNLDINFKNDLFALFRSKLMEIESLKKNVEKINEILDIFNDMIDNLNITEQTFKEEEYDYEFDAMSRGLRPFYASIFIENLIIYLQRNLGYGYIFMFDGLDSVTMDLVQYEIYDKWLKSISNITNNTDKPYKAVYLITIRDYSLIKFLREHLYKEATNDKLQYIKSFKYYTIKNNKAFDILKAKLDLFQYRLAKENLSVLDDDIVSIKYNIINLVYMTYNHDSLENVLNVPLKLRIELFNDIFGYNFRKLMKFLKMLVLLINKTIKFNVFDILKTDFNSKEFLNFFDGKEWLILRMLIFGDLGMRAYQNKVEYLGRINLKFTRTRNDFIPNIFNYFDKGAGEEWPRIFCKLRIIRYLQNMGGKESIKNILKYLSAIYNIENDMLRKEIREMIYTGLVDPPIDELTFLLLEQLEEGTDDYELKLLPLSYKFSDILRKTIYYEIIVDDTPIDSRIINIYKGEIIPLNRYDKRFRLDDYIIQKTKIILYFLYYLLKINEEEKKIVMSKINVDEEEYHKNYDVFIPDIINIVKSDMQKYIYKFLDSLDQIERRKFIEKWEINFSTQYGY